MPFYDKSQWSLRICSAPTSDRAMIAGGIVKKRENRLCSHLTHPIPTERLAQNSDSRKQTYHTKREHTHLTLLPKCSIPFCQRLSSIVERDQDSTQSPAVYPAPPEYQVFLVNGHDLTWCDGCLGQIEENLGPSFA